jgi:predicted aldo/keto reductase-like oxidoreductase
MGYNAPVLPEDKRISMVRRAFDQGVRYFDTARGYFESEAIMGQGLKPVRDQVYLATKIWAMKPEEVRPSVEASLKALDTDYADAMQIHGPIIERLDFDATMKIHAEMVKLRDEGLFRFIGLTNHVAFEKTHALIATGGFDQVMLAYGYCKGFHQMLSDRNVEWREMCIAEAHDQNMGLVLMKAFNGWVYNRRAGTMVKGYDEAELKKLPGAALRWVLQEKRFDMYNLGISYPEHLDEDIAIFSGDTTLTTADQRLLADFTGKVYESDWAKNLKAV